MFFLFYFNCTENTVECSFKRRKKVEQMFNVTCHFFLLFTEDPVTKRSNNKLNIENQ